MKQTVFQVDAFTCTPFTGNPAAVCVLGQPASEEWMQTVAREMNLSETAFLCAKEDIFNLRWFGPTREVELCGHATLASAHILWEEGEEAKEEEIRFLTRSGLLTATRNGEWINLSLPVEPPHEQEVPFALVDALGVRPLYVGTNRLDILVEVESEKVLRSLKPDFRKLCDYSDRGFVVTSRSTSDSFDYVTRFFAPGRGVNEDPVTGSAQCCLAPYWQKKLHKDSFCAYQASARGGVLRSRLQGDRVIVGGQAVTVMRGELLF
jgi:PhzF family phenazine biosynthesis protein